MAKLSRAEVQALLTIEDGTDPANPVAKVMKSKSTLRLLSKLQDKGMIEFDPFARTAKLTAVGRRHLG